MLFLTHDSPDLHPIGMIFAKVKQQLRYLACRSCDALGRAMPTVLDQSTSTDAAHCWRHCGYTLPME